MEYGSTLRVGCGTQQLTAQALLDPAAVFSRYDCALRVGWGSMEGERTMVGERRSEVRVCSRHPGLQHWIPSTLLQPDEG